MLERVLVGGWNLIRGKMIWLVLLCAVLLVPLGYAASQLKTDTSIETNVRKGSDTYNALMTLKNTFSDQAITVVITGKDVAEICSDQNLAAMKYVTDRVTKNDKVLFALSPEFFLSTLKSFGQVPADASPESVILDPKTGELTPQFKGSVFFDKQHAIIPIGLWKEFTTAEMTDFIKEVKAAVKDAGFDSRVQIVISGLSVVTDYMAREMPKTLSKLMIIVTILMLAVLAFAFRVRGKIFRRWLVLVMVGVSVIYAMGVLKIINMPMSYVSFVVFPIMLGLGVDYSVQFHNRYDEESRKGASANEGVTTTLRRTGPPIIMAMLLCMIGFASVLVVDQQQIFDFGISLIIGVAICMVVALTLLLGSLYLLDKRHDDTRKPVPRGVGALERSMGWVVPKVVKYAFPIIIVGIIFSGLGWYFERDIKSQIGFEGSTRDNLKEYQDMRYLQELAHGISPFNEVIEADNVLEPEILQWTLDQSNRLIAKEGYQVGGYVGSVYSLANLFEDNFGGLPATVEEAEGYLSMMPKPYWISLVKEDRKALNVNVNNTKDTTKECRQTMDGMDAAFANPPAGVKATTTGLSILGPILSDNLDKSRKTIMFLGVGLILLALFFMFRLNIKRVIAAAFPVLLVLGWGALFMHTAGIKVNNVMALLPAQMMAIGIEFTILLLMRYYEERDKGEEPLPAMTTAMTRIGRAILVSGGMVIIGFAVMLFAFNFPYIQDFGLVTLIDTVLVLVATLVVLPAIVLKFDVGKAKKAKA